MTQSGATTERLPFGDHVRTLVVRPSRNGPVFDGAATRTPLGTCEAACRCAIARWSCVLFQNADVVISHIGHLGRVSSETITASEAKAVPAIQVRGRRRPVRCSA